MVVRPGMNGEDFRQNNTQTFGWKESKLWLKLKSMHLWTDKTKESPKVETTNKGKKATPYDNVNVEREEERFYFTERNFLERESHWQAPQEEVPSKHPNHTRFWIII